MGDHLGLQGWSFKVSIDLSPNSIYPYLLGDMQRKIEKEQTALVPLI